MTLISFRQGWKFDHRFFARIDNFCDRKIDSILNNIESIFFKGRRERIDPVQSFKKDQRSTGAIRSFGLKGEKTVKNIRKIRFFDRFDLENDRIDLFQRLELSIRWRSIFFQDRRDRFDHCRSLFVKDRKSKGLIPNPIFSPLLPPPSWPESRKLMWTIFQNDRTVE